MPLAAKERSPEPDQESREIFPGDELLSHDLIPDTLCWRASSGKIEREQRTKGKERSVTVHTSFITTPKIVARTMDSSFAATECCTSNLLSTTSPTIDNQIGHSRHLSEILGTTTVIVGGAERIQRFEDLTRLIAAERAQKRLISKSSLAQLIEEFPDTADYELPIHYSNEDDTDIASPPFEPPANHKRTQRTRSSRLHPGSPSQAISTDIAEPSTPSDLSLTEDCTRQASFSPPVSERGLVTIPKDSQSKDQTISTKLVPSIISTAVSSLYHSITRRRRNGGEQCIPPPHCHERNDQGNTNDVLQWVCQSGLDSGCSSALYVGGIEAYKNNGEDGDYFMFCSLSQLQQLSPEVRDRVRVVKAYLAPPPSPRLEAITSRGNDISANLSLHSKLDYEQSSRSSKPNSDPLEVASSFTIEQVLNCNDFAPIPSPYEPRNISHGLGLRNYGIQVVGTNLAVNFDSVDNVSDWYFMPILESADQTRDYYHRESAITRSTTFTDINKVVENTTVRIPPLTKRPSRWRLKDVRKPVLETYNEEPIFFPKRTQPPSYSLILYLIGHGHSQLWTAEVVAGLSEMFVYNSSSRWWDGFRIPEHWELTATLADHIKVKCRREDSGSEVCGQHGDEGFKRVKDRLRVRRAGYLIKKVLENYLWMRLKGEIVHSDMMQL